MMASPNNASEHSTQDVSSETGTNPAMTPSVSPLGEQTNQNVEHKVQAAITTVIAAKETPSSSSSVTPETPSSSSSAKAEDATSTKPDKYVVPKERGVVTTKEDATLLITPNVSTVAGGQASVLFRINDRQLPGFHDQHVKRIGRNSVSPGLRVEIKPKCGENTENTLAVRCLIRDGEQTYTFAFINIVMAGLAEVVHTQVHESTDEEALNLFFTPGVELFPGAVVATHRDERHLEVFASLPEDASFGDYIAAMAETFVCATVMVKRSDLTMIYPPAFWDRILNFPQSLQDVARDVREELTNCLKDGAIAMWTFVFPATTNWESRWTQFQAPDLRRSPFQAFTKQCRAGQTDDLDYDNITLDNVTRDSCEAAYAFASRDERTVSLIAGAVDEALWSTQQARDCSQALCCGHMFPFPGSEWTKQDTDLDTYGMVANGAATAYMVIVKLDQKTKREQLPDIGSTVRLFLDADQDPHAVPQAQLSVGQIQVIATALQDKLHEALTKGANSRDNAQRRLDKLIKHKASEDEITEQEAIVDCISDRTYLRVATERLFGYISEVSNEVVQQMPNAKTEFRRMREAEIVAAKLRPEEGEDEIAHRMRIQTWLSAQRNIIRPHVNQVQGEPWRATRLNIPAGVQTDIALFYAEVPRQPDWPYGLKAPPLRITSPTARYPTNLIHYLNDVASIPYMEEIIVRMEYDVDDKSTRFEAKAVNRMNNVGDTSWAAEWWTYTQSFEEARTDRQLDLLQMFPGIKKHIEQGRFVGQHEEAAYSLSSTNLGKVFIAGGPGSGKSTFAAKLVDAVLEGGVAAVETTLTPAAVERQEREKLEREKAEELERQKAEELEKRRKAKEKLEVREDEEQPADNTWGAAQDTGNAWDAAQDTGNTWGAAQDTGNAWGATQSTDNTWGTEQSVGNPWGAEQGTDEAGPAPAVDEKEGPAFTPNDQGAAGQTWGQLRKQIRAAADAPENALVLWTAPQNAQVADAVERLRRLLTGKIIVRIHAWEAELKCFMSPETQTAKVMEIPDKATDTRRRLVGVMNQHYRARFEERSPAADPHSLSSQLRRMVESDPQTHANIVAAWEMHANDAVTYKVNLSEYKKEARELMEQFIRTAHVIAGTPVALMGLFNHLSSDPDVLRPSLVIVDEAGRLTEAMSLVPFAQHPNVPVIFIGDTRQFGPMVATAGDKNYKALFEKQRGMSLLKRVQYTGHVDFTLSANHRAHGDVHDWARGALYVADMKIVNGRNAYSATIHQWVIDECERSHKQMAQPATNMIFVDVADGQEKKQNASYVNSTNARYITELVCRLAASAPLFSADSYANNRFDITDKKSTDKGKEKEQASVVTDKKSTGKGKEKEQSPEEIIRQEKERKEKERQEKEQAAKQIISTYTWGRILVIVGYSEQKRMIEQTLSEIPEAELPRGLVSVRTIDDSPSHQAEVVICDLVRTDKPGFLIEDERLAVMTTRARVLTIIIGKSDVIKAKNGRTLNSLHDYLKSRDAVVRVSGWNEICELCLLPGHRRATCNADVRCNICLGNHSGRRCPNIASAPVTDLTLFKNVPPLDDTYRAAFSSIKFGKIPQSVKKMKAERQQAKETATTNAHKAYMRDVAAGYHEYLKEKEEKPVKDGSIAGPSRSGETLTFDRAALSNDDRAKVSSAKDWLNARPKTDN